MYNINIFWGKNMSVKMNTDIAPRLVTEDLGFVFLPVPGLSPRQYNLAEYVAHTARRPGPAFLFNGKEKM